MDSASTCNEKEMMVDAFLVEALQNPRHRLTILRMELDVQRFLHNDDQLQFEFPHYPTSYLRLAAHRVAQHYGLQTAVQDNGLDGSGNKILVRKTTESRIPGVRLSEIHTELSQNDKPENVKLVIRPRPKSSANETNGIKRSAIRSVEERKEEYERARARIFSDPGSPAPDDDISPGPTDGKNVCMKAYENENSKNTIVENEKSKNSIAEPEKSASIREGSTSSRVAILRDREKDLSDPDYDRSYDRYIRSLPVNQNFGLTPFNMENYQVPYAPYNTCYTQLGPMPNVQPSLNYSHPSNPVMSPFCAVGFPQASSNAAYIQWPSASMMYAHSYEQFRQTVYQAPFCQQPLSFGYSQNH